MNIKQKSKKCIAFLIGRVSQKLRAKLNHNLKQYDITAEQRQIILILNTYGSMSQRKLCELSMSEPSNLTITLKRMGKNGYIKKIKDPKDKRASLIETTQKACSLNDVIKEAGNTYKDSALKGIDQDKVDIAVEVLEKMHVNILNEEHQNLLQKKTKQALEVLG